MARLRAYGGLTTQWIVGGTTSSSTPTPDASTQSEYALSALTVNPAFGSPGAGYHRQMLIISVKASGGFRTATYNAIYVSGPAAMITSFGPGVWQDQLFMYNINNSKWVCMASDPVGYA